MLWFYDRHSQVAGRKKSARDPVISHLANVAIAEAGREVAYLQGCSSRPLPFGQRLTAGQAEGAGTTICQAGHIDHGVPVELVEPVYRAGQADAARSEEHPSELQSLMRNSYAGF